MVNLESDEATMTRRKSIRLTAAMAIPAGLFLSGCSEQEDDDDEGEEEDG